MYENYNCFNIYVFVFEKLLLIIFFGYDILFFKKKINWEILSYKVKLLNIGYELVYLVIYWKNII